MTIEMHERPVTAARRPAGHRRRGMRLAADARRPAGDRATQAMAKVAEEPPAVPRVRSVFRDLEGKLRHARCGRTMSLVGIRGGVELDFHCVGCWEHVTLTESTLGQVPVGQDTD